MIPLKKNFNYLVLNQYGQIDDSPNGSYYFDTRVLSHYKWDLEGFDLLHTEYEASSVIKQHFSKFGDHKQSLLIKRELMIGEHGFFDNLHIYNDDICEHRFTPSLCVESDCSDMFEVRGHHAKPRQRKLNVKQDEQSFKVDYTAEDSHTCSAELNFEGFDNQHEILIKARSCLKIRVVASYKSSLDIARPLPYISNDWLLNRVTIDEDVTFGATKVAQQAQADLLDLLLATKDGLTISAGIPWFVTPFGRDSIITSWFLLKNYPELTRGTLQFLSKHQGRNTDPFHDEQPGKILHEQRYGELSRIKDLPFATYYGTADATPLYLTLMLDYYLETKDDSLIKGLKENWEAALKWLETYEDDQGFVVFKGNNNALTVQSWKDSYDSLSYRDGRLGIGAIAVAEVQGYAYSAYLAVSKFYGLFGDIEKEKLYEAKALDLKTTFHKYYWMEEHSNYAIAIDEDRQKLDVNSSDSGHLLWSGIVDDSVVNSLVDRLFEDDLWSGYGLRTLSSKEARYNPISYHNGSVWPHDNGIFAAGLKRYGKKKAFEKVKKAMVEVACLQKDNRLPELFSGYQKGSGPILPYIEACRPQAWSAAALIYLLS